MKHISPRTAVAVAAVIALSACVAPPMASTIPVSPGPGKSFQAFTNDQAFCQQYAYNQTAPSAAAANQQAFGSALIGTALGAGLGAAIGGGRGAAIGAASGAVAGTAFGTGNTAYAQMTVQQQFDIMFGQCMAAHGNSVPGFNAPMGAPAYSAPPPGYGPPPGYYGPSY